MVVVKGFYVRQLFIFGISLMIIGTLMALLASKPQRIIRRMLFSSNPFGKLRYFSGLVETVVEL